MSKKGENNLKNGLDTLGSSFIPSANHAIRVAIDEELQASFDRLPHVEE